MIAANGSSVIGNSAPWYVLFLQRLTFGYSLLPCSIIEIDLLLIEIRP
jgi:hypothetical protein